MVRKLRRAWMAGLLSLTVLLVGLTPNIAMARESFKFSTASSAAKKAFSKILTNPKTISNWWGDSRDYMPKLSDIRFVCFDIGKEKVPILCMKNSKYAEGLCNVHQFVNGKSKILCGDDKIECVYPDKGIIVTSYMGGVGPNEYTDTSFSCVKSKTSLGKKIAYTRIWRFRASGSHLKNQYKINNKTVTKKKFDEWKRKMLSGERKVGISSKRYQKNTAEVRTKCFGKASAVSNKNYSVSAVSIHHFYKSEGKLIVDLDNDSDTGFFMKNGKRTKVKRNRFTIARKCKWMQKGLGQRGFKKFTKKITYKKMRKLVDGCRGLPENGYYSLDFHVKNKQLVKVVFSSL